MTQALDPTTLAVDLDAHGFAIHRGYLDAAACAGLCGLYDAPDRFRARIVMARHGFGRGEYQYFAYPLPAMVQRLRDQLYAAVVPIANRWAPALGIDTPYPATHAAFVERCHAAGQCRPTPLLLRYGPGDENRLHQDLYGALTFPLQALVVLATPGRDFTGGELVMTEQRPRAQSRVMVVPAGAGDLVVLANDARPVGGGGRTHRVRMRHGVSRVHSGWRMTLGIVFHDAV